MMHWTQWPYYVYPNILCHSCMLYKNFAFVFIQSIYHSVETICRLKEHVQDASKLPMLIFPEGEKSLKCQTSVILPYAWVGIEFFSLITSADFCIESNIQCSLLICIPSGSRLWADSLTMLLCYTTHWILTGLDIRTFMIKGEIGVLHWASS